MKTDLHPSMEYDQENGAAALGALLRASRTRRGEDLRYVADALRIRLVYLEAIEDGRFDYLPGTTYVIGFLKTYADYLGLNSEEIVRRFKNDESRPKKRQDLTFPTAVPEHGIPGGAIVMIGLVIAAIGYGGWYFASTQDAMVTEAIPPVPANMKAEPNKVASSESRNPLAEASSAIAAEANRQPAPAPAAASAPEPEMKADPAPVATIETPAAETAAETAVEAAQAQVAEQPAQPEVTQPAQQAETAEVSQPAEPQISPAPQPVEMAAAPTDAPTPTPVSDSAPAATKSPASNAASEPAAQPATDPAPEAFDDRVPGIELSARPFTVEAEAEPAVTPSAEATPNTAEAEVKTEPETPVTETAALPQPEPEVRGEDGPSRITLLAKDASWIQVRDTIENKLVLSKVLLRGQTYEVPGRTGLSLMTGNAGALEIRVDGQPVPPIGALGQVLQNVQLSADTLREGAGAGQ
ncbi:MAG: RodZ domain-containing protein [Rhodospirillaceae bacterium]